MLKIVYVVLLSLLLFACEKNPSAPPGTYPPPSEPSQPIEPTFPEEP